jgi:hypothetical protein
VSHSHPLLPQKRPRSGDPQSLDLPPTCNREPPTEPYNCHSSELRALLTAIILTRREQGPYAARKHHVTEFSVASGSIVPHC